MIGQRLGPFRVEAELGEDEAGTVYRAVDERGDEAVAIKVFAANWRRPPESLRRLLREVPTLEGLRHPNIVGYRAFDLSGPVRYCAMEYVAGPTLEQVLRDRGAIPWREVVDFGIQLCSALHHAHERGLVHRSLSPPKIRLGEEGRFLIADLGISGDLDFPESDDSGTTLDVAPNWSRDVVAYWAPEQIRGMPEIGPATDLYALGVIFYRMLSGVLPFTGPKTIIVMHAQLVAPPPRPSRQVEALPRVLDELVVNLLAKAPEDRPRDASAVEARLRGLRDRDARHEPISMARPEVGPAPASEPSLPLPRLERVRKGTRGPLSALESPPTPRPTEAARSIHEVQFTVYRPRAIAPDQWHPLLAFTHLAERRPDAPAQEPDPIEQVRAQARRALGARASDFRDTSVDARQAIPRAGEITLIPDVSGLTFNPDRRSFRWVEDVHREEFRLRAARELDGKVARGRLSAYFGSILIAEVDLAIRVDSRHHAPAEPAEPTSARPYRKIFASYSHKDREIVRQYEQFVETLGDRYCRDVRDLRAGEGWDDALLRMIEGADVFQLFWSRHSMASPFVRREWEHALSLNRPSFVRPTYWEDPLPESPERGLPPEVLRKLHFHRIAPARPEDREEAGRKPAFMTEAAPRYDETGMSAAFMTEAPRRSNVASGAAIGLFLALLAALLAFAYFLWLR